VNPPCGYEIEIRRAQPKDKPYKLADGARLHLLDTPNGSRLGWFRYRHAGREGMARFGAYPTVTLKEARKRAEAAREELEKDVTPAARRRAERTARDSIFSTLAEEWLSVRQPKLAERALTKTRWMLNTIVIPKIGARPGFSPQCAGSASACQISQSSTRTIMVARGLVHGYLRPVFGLFAADLRILHTSSCARASTGAQLEPPIWYAAMQHTIVEHCHRGYVFMIVGM